MKVDQFPGASNRANPYNRLLVESLEDVGVHCREYSIRRSIVRSRADIVHVHWPEYGLSRPSLTRARLSLRRFFFGMRLHKARSTKIVWTAHNLRPHERNYPKLETWFYHKWLGMVDGVICLSETSRLQLIERYPSLKNKPIAVIPHGTYEPILSGNHTKNSARLELGIPEAARVIGSFGAVRDYKNLPHLVQIFKQIPGDDLKLIIAGKPSQPELADALVKLASNDSRVMLELEYLSDDRMEVLHAACDCIVLAYRDILNSGSALYALSANRPCLAPNLGSIEELQTAVTPIWLKTYTEELDASKLQEAIVWFTNENRDAAPNMTAFDWKNIATQTKAFYQSLTR